MARTMGNCNSNELNTHYKKNTTLFILLSLTILLLIYSLLLATFSLTGFPKNLSTGYSLPYLADKPVKEDGYYMLVVAWNFASGHGFKYNYDIITTGVQPLSTIIYGGLAYVIQLLGGDKWSFVRVVLTFGVVNLLLFAHIVGKIAQTFKSQKHSKLTYALTYATAAFNFWLFRGFTYGLETGIYLTILAALILYTLRNEKLGPRESLIFGVLAGLCGLARIDFGLVLFVYFAIVLFRRQMTLSAALIAGLTALLIVSPWFIWVHSVTGHWIPSSGLAQTTLISTDNFAIRSKEMILALLEHLTPWIYSGKRNFLYFAGALSLILIIIWILQDRKKPFRINSSNVSRTISTWFLALMTLVFVYPIFFWATHFYARYSMPINVVTLPLFASTIAVRLRNKVTAVKVGSLFLLPLCFTVYTFLSLHTGNVGNTHTITAGFIQENFPPPVKVGVFQSGVIGFFNPNVVNLDGKVNAEALEYSKQGKLHEYLDKEEIEVLVDWPSYIFPNINENYLTEKWEPCDQGNFEYPNICLVRIQR